MKMIKDAEEELGRATTRCVAKMTKTSKRTGRPRIEERAKTNEAKKPWLRRGMSRSTWYRRQAEKRKKNNG